MNMSFGYEPKQKQESSYFDKKNKESLTLNKMLVKGSLQKTTSVQNDSKSNERKTSIDLKVKKNAMNQDFSLLPKTGGSIRQEMNKLTDLNSRVLFEESDDEDLQLVSNDKFSARNKFKISKSFNREVCGQVAKKVAVVTFLSVVIYLQVFHYASFTRAERRFLPGLFHDMKPFKSSPIFLVFSFLAKSGFLTLYLSSIFVVFLYNQEQVNLHLTMCNFFLYTTLGVFVSLLLSGERPFWGLDTSQDSIHLCKRSFSNPDLLLFNFFGFFYYFMNVLRRFKVRVFLRGLFVCGLFLFNVLVFMLLYIDAQIYLSAYCLMPGLSLACIYLLKPFKKPLKKIFEGLYIKKSKHKTKRFNLLLILLLVIFLQNSVYWSIISSDRNVDYISKIIECYSQRAAPGQVVLPNNSYDKIVGAYPTIVYSQGVYALSGMLVGLFVSHRFIKDNRFWFEYSRRVFYWRLVASFFVVGCSMGRLSPLISSFQSIDHSTRIST